MFLIKAKLFFHKECVKSIMSDHILQFLHIVIIISTLTKKTKTMTQTIPSNQKNVTLLLLLKTSVKLSKPTAEYLTQ